MAENFQLPIVESATTVADPERIFSTAVFWGGTVGNQERFIATAVFECFPAQIAVA
jgi:hypothetical protein